MNPSELDKVVAYTKKFIDAALPIVKQAYETGLLTLRIDAAQSIVFGLALLVMAVLGMKKIRADYAVAKVIASVAKIPESRYSYIGNEKRLDMSRPSYHMAGEGIPYFIGGIFSCVAAAFALYMLLNVWLWVKLFAPELWLAGQAVKKIIN